MSICGEVNKMRTMTTLQRTHLITNPIFALYYHHTTSIEGIVNSFCVVFKTYYGVKESQNVILCNPTGLDIPA